MKGRRCQGRSHPRLAADHTSTGLKSHHPACELTQLLSLTFQRCQITVELGDNDADTSIVGAALAAAIDSSVGVSL